MGPVLVIRTRKLPVLELSQHTKYHMSTPLTRKAFAVAKARHCQVRRTGWSSDKDLRKLA